MHLTENDSNDIGRWQWAGRSQTDVPTLGSKSVIEESNLLKQIIAPPRCTYPELQGALERWKEPVRRYERRRDDNGVAGKLDADIKLSAIELLVPTDIENHPALNKYRIKTFDEALTEIAFILESRTGGKLKEPAINHPCASYDGGQPIDID